MEIKKEKLLNFISYGYGYGCGNGDSYGNGCGYGNGNGYGKGNGNGYGYGNGNYTNIKSINGMPIFKIDNVPTAITQIRDNIAKGYIVERNTDLKPCYVIKHENLFAHGETLKQARQALEEKIFANMNTDEVISEFIKTFPKINKKYDVLDFYTWHNRLTGSCEMGRKSFAKQHNIDIENDKMTVKEFIEITKDSFGGNIIQELEKEYKEV